ncbi:MAG: signal recognition particle-docking protein FtsY [Pseudomonadota bacterium]
MAKNFLKGLFGRKKDDTPPEDSPQAEDLEGRQPGEDQAADANLLAADDPNVVQEATAREVEEARSIPVSEPPTMDVKAPEALPQGTPHEAEAPLPDTDFQERLESETPVVESEAPPNPPTQDDAEPKKSGWLSRLRNGLSRSSTKLSEGVTSIFTKRKLDDETLEELEDLLITADLGVSIASQVTTKLANDRFDKEVTDAEVKIALAEIVAETLEPLEAPLEIDKTHKPHVILMTGVNGAGKTTTIGKLAAAYKRQGMSVMLAAGDTFRAAAVEQLKAWGDRTDTEVVARDIGADAAGLAFDAVKTAKEQNVDVLLIDTAGRLQNRAELMDELAKIVRVVKKIDETAPHHTLLVLDATVGQNAIAQAQVFQEIAQVSGLVMTKLDGTARGGVLVALGEKFKLPIHYVGVGESVDDLQPFRADAFGRALTGVAAIKESTS